jgi:TetR/AcrR family transcriptional regulator, mexJK operon transcriptional repressor
LGEKVGTVLEDKRNAILKAAQDLFLDRGFRATTMKDIVLLVGGSMTAPYRLFGNKMGILRAIIDHRCSEILSSIAEEPKSRNEPEATLRAMAEDMLSRLVDSVQLLRLVIAESKDEPNLGRQLYEQGVCVIQSKIEQTFRTFNDIGVLRIPLPAAAAVLFHRAVIGEQELKSLLGLSGELTSQERSQHIDFVVSSLLQLYLPPK